MEITAGVLYRYSAELYRDYGKRWTVSVDEGIYNRLSVVFNIPVYTVIVLWPQFSNPFFDK